MPLTEWAEERDAADVNGTDSIPVCGVRSVLTGYRESEEALNRKQKIVLHEEAIPFVEEAMGTAELRNEAIRR